MHPELYRPPSAYLSDHYAGKPATPRQRIYAALIDWVILISVGCLLFAFGKAVADESFGDLLAVLGLVLLGAVQFGCLRKGQTLGKRRLKIRVVGENGRPVSALRLALLRWGLFWVVPLIGIFSSLGGLLPEGRALHDVVAKTKVVAV